MTPDEEEVKAWPDEVLRACADVSEMQVFMELLRTLSRGQRELLLVEMREAVAMGDMHAATRREAAAAAWKAVPRLIDDLAAAWRRSTSPH